MRIFEQILMDDIENEEDYIFLPQEVSNKIILEIREWYRT